MLNEEPALVAARDAARRHGMKRLGTDVFPYLAAAVEAHLTSLLRAMGRTASQRTDPGRCGAGCSGWVGWMRARVVVVESWRGRRALTGSPVWVRAGPGSAREASGKASGGGSFHLVTCPKRCYTPHLPSKHLLVSRVRDTTSCCSDRVASHPPVPDVRANPVPGPRCYPGTSVPMSP